MDIFRSVFRALTNIYDEAFLSNKLKSFSRPFIVFVKNSIIDVWRGHKYVPEINKFC